MGICSGDRAGPLAWLHMSYSVQAGAPGQDRVTESLPSTAQGRTLSSWDTSLSKGKLL